MIDVTTARPATGHFVEGSTANVGSGVSVGGVMGRLQVPRDLINRKLFFLWGDGITANLEIRIQAKRDGVVVWESYNIQSTTVLGVKFASFTNWASNYGQAAGVSGVTPVGAQTPQEINPIYARDAATTTSARAPCRVEFISDCDEIVFYKGAVSSLNAASRFIFFCFSNTH